VPGDYPYGMHSGVGGLAHLLSEIRLTRELTDEEQALAHGITEALVRRIADETDHDYFDGLVSTLGILTAAEPASVSSLSARTTSRGVGRTFDQRRGVDLLALRRTPQTPRWSRRSLCDRLETRRGDRGPHGGFETGARAPSSTTRSTSVVEEVADRRWSRRSLCDRLETRRPDRGRR
jgi:hypothetical protein